MTKVNGLNLCNATCGVGRRMAKTVAPEKVSRLDREFLENGSKKLTKLFTAIFFLFLIGVGNVWADTYTWNMASGDLGKNNSGSTSCEPATSVSKGSPSTTWSIDWTWVNSSNKYLGWEGSGSTRGIQIGKSDYGSNTVVLSTSGISGTITNVTVNGAIAKSGNATIAVSVGSTGFTYSGNSTASLTTTATGYAFTGSASGTISITMTSSAEKAMYIKSISVTYSAATTYSVTYNLNGGSGTTPTETNKASGATFTLHNGTSSITAPAGKSFNKWKDQDDDLYSGGATYTMPAKNVTLTAQWSCITPTITGHPAAATYWDMDSPTALTVTASGGSLSYQWQMSADGSSSWSDVGTNSSSYTPLVANGTKYYRCIVTNTGSSCNTTATSNNALVTIKTLSSIAVKTSPQTTYLAGETFSPTNLVITLTATDASTQDRSYASYSSGFTFSPTTATALTTSNDEVSITYGGQSDNLSINVYSVTVNKVNINGVAISAAGVTASCSGRTLSQSVGSTNYLFNSYAVTAGGVDISGSTITGTPTGNVTINAKFHDPITVTWKVGNGAASGTPTTEVQYGTKISTLPSTPADNALASCGTNKFMGWSANELIGTGNSAPADLFTAASGASNLTSNTTYRAVFASSTSGAAANTVLFSENWTGVTNNTTPSSPSENGSSVYGGATITYTWTDGTTTTQTYTSGGPNSNENILISKSNGAWKANGIKTGNASKIVFTYAMSGSGVLAVSSPTSNVSVGGSSSGSYITFTDEVSTFDLEFKNTNSSNNLRLDDIEVKVYTAGTTAVDYQTGCCTALGEPATLTLENTAYTIEATWTATSGGNETGYSVQLYDNSGGDKGSAIGDPISRTSSQLTYTFEDLTANHKYFIGVTPTYSGAGDYCTTGTEKLVSATTDQVYTVTYNNGGGSGTMTDDNSPYEAGDEVTVKENTFTKSGYTFTAWSYSPEVTVTDGKFDMPSSNVVITATWTAKKNYYVDRMHGNCDGVNTVTIGGVVYNCYLREGASYTRPDLSDNNGGTNDCVTGHEHFIGWVAAGNVSADGSYNSGTIYAGGSSGTATTDGTIYYAVWAEE